MGQSTFFRASSVAELGSDPIIKALGPEGVKAILKEDEEKAGSLRRS